MMRSAGKLRTVCVGLAAAAALILGHAGCKPKGSDASAESGGALTTIHNKGSDTMVNVAQIWAEEYKKAHPHVDVEVSGGGSGVGIAALIRGTIEIATSSRDMKSEEKEQASRNTGKDPVEFVVGYDALVIYVHKDNPLDEITHEQLIGIFAEGGKMTNWSDLGVVIPGKWNQIVRISRQSSSGTYEFFREHVLNNKDFKLGSRDMNGSKEVVELVAATRTAIGYSGLGYNEPGKVKMLRVSPKAGIPAVAPSVETTMSKEYPIARSLLLYTLGEPTGELKNYIDWILSDAGQAIVERSGYVPLRPQARNP